MNTTEFINQYRKIRSRRMPYIVFQNCFKGFKHLRGLDGDNLEKVIESIEKEENQCYMFYIYRQHELDVPLLGTRFDTYRFVKAVAGKKYGMVGMRNDAHEYALTHNASMAWFFTDNMFDCVDCDSFYDTDDSE